MKLEFAHLSYGDRLYPVTPNETLPLPKEFDFSKPEECAKLIFAIMSNASGGHTLRNCKVSITPSRKTANLTCNGVHVFYRDPSFIGTLQGLSDEEVHARLEQLQKERKVYELGNVRTDQYGDGYKRAVWF